MGCCSGRIKAAEALVNRKDGGEIIDKSYFSSLHSNYYSNKQNFYKKTFNVASVENKRLNEELEALSQARESVALDKISVLLDSETPVTMEQDAILHSWAENPKTISTLAGIQLGIFASDKDMSRSPDFTQNCIKYKILDKLVAFIRSDQRDKFEAGVLALSFLTENNSQIVENLLKKNIIAVLVKYMKDKKEGLKATAALCCRNLYLARPNVQRTFVREGGAECLVALLDSDDSVTVFETILNLLDLLLDSDDTIQLDIKKHLVALGVQYHLQRISREISRYEIETIKEAEKLNQLFD